ncbi:copper amine oxidase [Xylogone sp. PMI_703]|nr:copper amine oxidase [Xylogone sp. PMI_703]
MMPKVALERLSLHRSHLESRVDGRSDPVEPTQSIASLNKISPNPRPHPLLPLKADEIAKAASIISEIVHKREDDTSRSIYFKYITLYEPPKAILFPYLDAESSGVAVVDRPFVPRCAQIAYTDQNQENLRESVISLDTETEISVSEGQKGHHGPLDRDEVIRINRIILTDPEVRKAVSKLGLPADAVIQCDTWPYGADKYSNINTPKLTQCMLYARAPHGHPESNQYSFPIPVSPVVDIATGKVVRLDPLPTGGKEDGLKHHTAPNNAMAHCVENEYYAPIMKGKMRDDLKPLIVVQPEGPSFTVDDETRISWQKWQLRVGFNWREGMTVHNVRYDGRKLFYRLSMSEMTVPYGDPRSPYHRRQAFDLGEAGAGNTANNLSLGCDCLGTIQYFDFTLNDSQGKPINAPNVICLHEQDAGIGWKHTNPRTDVAAITRGRSLVLQSIITVGNYEYVFAWMFYQNGTIEFETRATGILATSLIDAGKTSNYGNVVSPGVLAANHQHLFCLRVDPMLDGMDNTILQEESITMPASEEANPFGNAWKVVRTPITKSGFADAAPQNARVFKIVNEHKHNPISGNPVGYKLVPQPAQLLLCDKSSMVRKRARFAEHHIWVTKYRDGDLWAGGKWTNQSLIEVDGVADYAARNEDVRDSDVVLWHTYGITHNPRVEDYPVMPVETMTIALKPVDFFDRNPALDVPPSTQAFNKSVLVGGQCDVVNGPASRACC